MAEYEHQLPGPLNWLNKGAGWLGGLLGHVVPGMNRAMNDPTASFLDQLKVAGLGGLEAGTAATGLGAAFPALTEGAIGAGGGMLADLASSPFGAGADWLRNRGMTGALEAGAGEAGAATGAAEAGGKGALGRMLSWPLQHKGMALGGLVAGDVLKNKFFGKGGTASGSPSDIVDAYTQLGIPLSEEDAKARQRAVNGYIEAGMDQQTARELAFPELGDRLKAQQQTQRQLALQSMVGLMNPWIQRTMDAASQQAKALRGMLPGLPRNMRPVAQAMIGGETAQTDESALASALSALSGGVGVPSLTSGGGNASQQLVQQFLQGGQGQSADLSSLTSGP